MKNFLIAILSVAVLVLAFLLWKSKCNSQNDSFGFTSEYKEYLKDLKLENVSNIDSSMRDSLVDAYVDSLFKYRSTNSSGVLKDSIERFVYFAMPELDSLLKKIPNDINRKDYWFKIYLGHYANTSEIKKYLKDNKISDHDISKYYLNRNTVILQIAGKDFKNIPNAAMNVGSICPPKCSKKNEEYQPIK